MSVVRLWVALALAKATYRGLRLLGRNASNLPGWLALHVCPDFLELIAKPELVVCVTGTNGKTTVTNMIADVLVGQGYSVSTNRLGSNIAPGIASSLTNAVSWSGKPNKDACVLEVDERASRLILPYVRPTYLVVTNLFRDSLKRNAHPDYIFDVLDTYTPDDTRLVLNGDDLCSSRLGERAGNPRVFFGIESMAGDRTDSINLVSDYSTCPRCHTGLAYDHLRYHHIGRAHCPACGFASQDCDYVVERVESDATSFTVAHDGATHTYPLVSTVTFNIYNQLAVIATLTEIGLDPARVEAGLSILAVVDSRLGRTQVGDVTVVQAMSKGQSCVSTSRTLDFVTHEPGRKVVVLAMDDWYDRKTSVEYIGWIYDADFEFLADPDVVQVIACGPRCYDYEVRLLLAGVPHERIQCCESEADAHTRILTAGMDSVYILYDTSTYDVAMSMKARILSTLEGAAR
ncbi:MAG: MurT ligase domain-containing protein [Propionibacteriaceae bacterium]|nr:MurT ligase domain-containing protein [Propionibacteriaceae bacterium]